MHMVKKHKILVWGGPHGVTKRIGMRLESHQITFSPIEKLNVETFTGSQKRALLKHLCGNKECCREVHDLEWCYDDY